MHELPAPAAVRRSVDPARARARHAAVVAGSSENDVAVPRIDSEVVDVRERKGPRRSRAADDRWLPLRVPPRLAPVVRAPDARVAAEIRPPAVGRKRHAEPAARDALIAGAKDPDEVRRRADIGDAHG